jgi:DNA invertase Pin-like site-specific DNA recombinase
MKLYCYVRVSTDRQENSAEAQESRLTEWAAKQGMEIERIFRDIDQSAHSIQLKARREGKLLWDALAPGDTLAFTKVDRAFRSLADAAPAMQTWRELGIRIRILDLDLDLSSPAGELFFSQLVAFAQFESRLHGQRKREVYAHKRAKGEPYHRVRPYGWLVRKDRNGRHWEALPAERTLAAEAASRRAQGHAYYKIASDLCVAGHRKPGGGYYHPADIRCLIRAAEAGFPRLPQGSWQAPDYEQKLRAARESGLPL